jgi:hypothetical protein
VIDAESAALLQAEVSLYVATVDESGAPNAERAFALQVLDGGTRVRVSVPADNHVLQANLAATGVVAITGNEIVHNTAVQIKGRVAGPAGPETAADRARREQHVAAFVTVVHDSLGTSPDVIDRRMPREFVVFEVTVEAVYDQTPGPSAGRRLAPA